MEFVVRDTQESDLKEILELENSCFSMPRNMDQLRGELKDGMHEFLAAVGPDGTVLGYAGMTYIIDEGYISNVAVNPAARRNGIACTLVEELKNRGAELKLKFITLEVREGNTGARALYEKCGFATEAILKDYYYKPKENAIIMTLRY